MSNYKTYLDAVSLGTVISTIIGWLPPIAAGMAAIWTAIQIYESNTFKRLIKWLRRE